MQWPPPLANDQVALVGFEVGWIPKLYSFGDFTTERLVCA
jgi:hypothetical protein